MAGINLKVQIEINGQFVQTGHITGSSFRDAAFSYDESYITSSAARAISLSLPLSKKDFDTDGTVTLYEYDIKGQLSTVYYPYTKAKEVALKEEAEENRMPTVAECGINKYLDSGARNGLSALLNRISWNYGSKILAMQLFIKDSYKYDGNGNRIQKITPYGTIDYTYNEENFLISSGWNGKTGIVYTYDREGNLLTQESEVKTVKYAYNAQNRIMYSEVTNKKEKIHAVSYYGYDAFGRRVLVQDKDEARLRTLYDGFTFETVKESPTFANGLFTDSYETGIRITSTGRPTGDRYRYLEDDSTNDSNRYFYLNEGTYKNISSRYQGSRTSITVNGIIASQNADGNITYFTTDLLGSVRTTSNAYGTVENSYSYDAFGSIVEGDLSGTSDYGYLGKQFNKQTGLYNYGYRDYTPATARFTTVDPIHDGTNWTLYCNNDPVNFVDLWGLKADDIKKKEIVSGVVDGKRLYGKVSDDLIGLLKRIETPQPDTDGKIGLHLPGDGTLTYGYGEKIDDAQQITENLKKQYPDMNEAEATKRLTEIVLPAYVNQVNNRLYNRGMTATQQEFDAYVLSEYNTNSGPLMDKIKTSTDKSDTSIKKIFSEHKITYPGLLKRREAEAILYTEGDYSEDFKW